MDAQHRSKTHALFLEAAGLPEDARAEYLDQACGGDAALRAAVEALLAGESETRAASPTEPPTVPGEPDGKELPAGTRLGPWRIARLVGRGGMGEVYEAQRADGTFELRAAVKLLKRGLDTDAVVARFNRERRLLAQLDHPNIAHVLDAGVAPDGRPFLVMEYVDGLPITEYVRAHPLPVPELLRLVATVCEAVQAAHARKIVHRDLKPSNVLVTAQGQVKLLDFGIAKALTEEDDSEATRLGGGGAMTPAYAAPEQLLELPATPASDVYALGCILYQLLVERLPHARGGRTTRDIARGLERETVDRPSTVLRRERGRLPEPTRLARLKSASGDLDLIVLKALHAEPQRRYADAHQLAEDLQRLLEKRPVLARPDSAVYRLGRFVRRNRLPVAATLAVVTALSLGLAAALWQGHIARLRRQQADDLINFMLGDLQDQLRQVGRLDVLDTTVTKVMDYLGTQTAATGDAEALSQRVAALSQIATIKYRRGEQKEAQVLAREALAAARRLQRLRPGPRSEALLVQALEANMRPLVLQGKLEQVGQLGGEALEIVRRLRAGKPQDPELAVVQGDLDTALSVALNNADKPDAAGADALLRDCIDLLQPLAGRPDSSPALSDQLIGCELNRSAIYLRDSSRKPTDGRSVTALNLAMIEDARQAMERFPRSVHLLDYVQHAFVNAADALEQVPGEIGHAETAASLAVQVGERLVALDPEHMGYLSGLARAKATDAEVKLTRKDWPAARQAGREAEALFDRYLAHVSQDSNVRSAALAARLDVAHAIFGTGDRAGALHELATGLALVPKQGGQGPIREKELGLRAYQWLYSGNDAPPAQDARAAVDELAKQLARDGDLSPDYAAMAAYIDARIEDGDRIYGEALKQAPERSFDSGDFREQACKLRLRGNGPRCQPTAEFEARMRAAGRAVPLAQTPPG
jgi:serine/threonine-protein kinase